MIRSLIRATTAWRPSSGDLPSPKGDSKPVASPETRVLLAIGAVGLLFALVITTVLLVSGGNSHSQVRTASAPAAATVVATVAAPIATPVPIQVIVVAPTPVPTPPCTQIRHDRWRQDDLGVWHQDTWYTCD